MIMIVEKSDQCYKHNKNRDCVKVWRGWELDGQRKSHWIDFTF